MPDLLFSFAKILYNHCFPAYKVFYFAYKKWTDREMIRYFNENISPNAVILDVGANIGFFTLLFSKLAGNGGMVIAFEPDEKNFSKLAVHTKNKRNIRIHPFAVHHSTVNILLYLSSWRNFDHMTYDIGENRKTVSIPAVNMDDFMERNYPGLTVDVIKIDIQGSDYFAFQGMSETIKKSRNVILCEEFWPYGLEKALVKPVDYYNALLQAGFKVEFIPPLPVSEIIARTNDYDFYLNFIATTAEGEQRQSTGFTGS